MLLIQIILILEKVYAITEFYSCDVTTTEEINKKGNYQFTIVRQGDPTNPPIALITNYFIQIDFPWVINSDYTCYNEDNSQITCQYSTTSQTIIKSYFVQNYGNTDYSNSDGFSFIINLNSVMNPSYSGTYDSPIQVSIMSGSNQILEQCPNGGVKPLVNPGTATCYGDGLQSKVNTINQSMSLTIIVANILQIESYLVVQYTQYWQNDQISKEIIPSSITCVLYGNNVEISSAACTKQTGFLIKSTIGAAYSATNITLVVQGINSPSSTSPVGTFTIQTFNSNNKQIDQCSTSQVANWFPNQVVSQSMTWTQIINSVDKLNLIFQLNSQILIGDVVTITFPKEIIVNSNILTQIKDTKSSFFSSSTSSFGLSGQQVTITSTKAFSATLTNIQLTFYNVGSPPSTKPTSSISIATYRGSYLIDQSSTSLTISASQGQITFVSIIAVNTVINQLSDYNFQFTLTNHLLQDGYIVIQFPTQFNLEKIVSLTNYKINSISQTAEFSVSSQKLIISSLSSADIASLSQISFTISQIQNQFSAKISNAFSVQTYYSKSTQDYLVDQHLTFQMSSFTSGSIDSSSIKISAEKSITGSKDNYIVEFINTNSIMVQGYILLTLSADITIYTGAQICYINNVVSQCSQTDPHTIKVITQTTISRLTDIVIKINNSLINCWTFKTITNALSINTYDDQNLMIDSGSGGSITMLYLSEFSLALASRSSVTNGMKATYTFKINFDVKQINGIYLILVTPSDLQFDLHSCSSTSPLSTTLPCSFSSSQLLLQLTCNTCTEIPEGQDLLITVNYIINYFSLMPISLSTGSTIQDLQDQLSKQSQLKASLTITNSATNSIASYSQAYSNGYMNQLDNYSFSFTLKDYLINYFQITISVPSDIVTYQQTDTVPTTLSNVVNLPSDYTFVISSQNIIITGFTNTQISTFSLTINNLLNPSKITSSTSFTIITYSIVNAFQYQMDTSNLNIYSHKCTLPCKDCSSSALTQCSSCYDTNRQSLVNSQIYRMSTLTTCVANCYTYTGFFVPVGEFDCQQCNLECKTCKDVKTYCITCNDNLKFYNNQCLDACPTGYYNNQLQCQKCIDNCDICSNSTQCITCATNFYLYQSVCNAVCPAGITITNITLQSCDLCTNNCQTCQTATSTCLTCVTNYYLFQNTCVSKCKEGTFLDSTKCTDCQTKCKTCNSSTTCSSCNSPAIFYLDDCIGQCPDQYFTINGTCQQCNFSCATCEITQYKCKSCFSSTYLYNNSCSGTCPDFYFADQSLNKCVQCVEPCLTCKSSSQCLSCISQVPVLYYYNYSCHTSCLSYYAPENGSCVQCRLPCKQCTSTPDTCSECYPNTYLLGTLCVTDCGDGNYKDNQSYTCNSCKQPCKTCVMKDTQCQSCTGILYLFQSTCVDKCSDGYYSSEQQCLQCLTVCQTCLDGSTCQKCKDNLIMYNNQCLTQCPANLFLENHTCIGCRTPCLTCQGTPDACTTCQQSTYLNSSSLCVSNCGDGYYGDQVSNKCIICVSPCKTCSSTTSCLSCITQIPYLYFYDNSCHTDCKTNYAPENYMCVACRSPCKSCNTTPDTCLSCETDTYLMGNQCETDCGEGNFPDPSTNKCQKCQSPCLTCSSLTLCNSCLQTIEAKLFYNNGCISSCPTGYYEQNGTCMLCTLTSNNSACQSTVTAIQSIQAEKFFPMPFTILTFIFIISVIVAKIQRPETFIPGAICSFGGFFEWCSHCILLYLSYLQWHELLNLQNYIMIGAIGVGYLLNIINLIASKIIFHNDLLFQQWLQSRKVNQITYAIVSMFSFLTTFKANKLLVSRYFGFYFFKARLSNVHELLTFNIISLLSILFNSIPMIVASTLLISIHDQKDQLYISSIDCIIVTFIIFIAQIWDAQKQDDYFHEPGFQSLNQSLGQVYRLDQSDQLQQQQPVQSEQQAQQEVIVNDQQVEEEQQQENVEQVNIESTNNQKKNFLMKNKSLTMLKHKNSAVVPLEIPYFPTQNNDSSSQGNSDKKRFTQYIKKETAEHKNPDEQSLDLSSISHDEQFNHPLNDFSQEKDFIQDYQVLSFQNPEQLQAQPLATESQQDMKLASDLDLNESNENQIKQTTPQNINTTNIESKFKKRNKTLEVVTLDENNTNEAHITIDNQPGQIIEQTPFVKINQQQTLEIDERDQQLAEKKLQEQLPQERLNEEKIKQDIIEQDRLIKEKIEEEKLIITKQEEAKLQQLKREQQQKEELYQENLKQCQLKEEAIKQDNEKLKQILLQQEQEKQQVLLQKQQAEDERKRIQKEEKKKMEEIQEQNKLKEQLLLKEKEESQRLWQLQLSEQQKKQKEQEIRELELKKELEKEKEEKLKFQIQLSEKILREEQDRMEAERMIKEKQQEIQKLEFLRQQQLQFESERLKKVEQEAQRILLEQLKIKEEERIRIEREELEAEQHRIKQQKLAEILYIQEQEEKRINQEKEQQMKNELLQRQKQLDESLKKVQLEQSDEKKFDLIQFDYNEEDEIEVLDEQPKKEKLFLQIEVSDEEGINKLTQFKNESIQSAQEELINFYQDEEVNHHDQNEQFEINNPTNIFAQKQSSQSINIQHSNNYPQKIHKTIQDQPSSKPQPRSQYQFLPKKSNPSTSGQPQLQQLSSSRQVQRQPIKYPNSSNTPTQGQNRLQVSGNQSSQHQAYNNFAQKSTITKEKDDRYIRQKEEIYLQHIPNYYEKQVQEELKKKKQQQQKKNLRQSQQKQFDVDDDIHLGF